MSSMRRNYLRVLALLHLILLLLGLSSTVRPQSSLASLPNNFPVAVSGEAFRGQSTRVATKFKVFFPFDEQRYLPVDSRIAEFLSYPPSIVTDPDLKVIVLSTECRPQEMVVKMGKETGVATGGEVSCLIEITPDLNARVGERTVSLIFPAVDLIFYKVTSKQLLASVNVTLNVWASPQAKQEFLRIEEEKQRKQQEALRIAEEQRRQQERLDAQKRYDARVRFVKSLLPYMAIVLLIAFFLFLQRKWIWPDMKVRMSAGESNQFHAAIPMLKSEEGTEPGTILSTIWAKRWPAGRRRIKAETFVSEETSRSTGHKFISPSAFIDNYYANRRLDVLVSVGASVKAGIHLAKSPNGTIRITVQR